MVGVCPLHQGHWRLYQFSTPAVTNYHHCRDSEQHSFIILRPCISEVPHRSPMAKVRLLAGSAPVWRLSAEPIALLLQFVEASHMPWLMAPPTIYKANNRKQTPPH